MSEESDQPRPVLPALDYATPTADGLAEWIPHVEAAIDAGADPTQIGRHFAHSWDGAAYFAKSLSRRFAVSELAGHCCSCTAATDRVAKVEWTAKAAMRTLEFGVAGPGAFNYTTYHSVCPGCIRRWERRVAIAEWMRLLWRPVMRGGQIGLLLLIPLGIHSSADLPWELLFGGALSAIVVGWLMRTIHTWLWRNAMPRRIQSMERKGAWIQAADFCTVGDLRVV